MSEQSPTTTGGSADETPVMDVLVAMTAASLERTTLDPQTLMLVRLAALVALDAPPLSYLLNLQVGRRGGGHRRAGAGRPGGDRPGGGRAPRRRGGGQHRPGAGIRHRRGRRGAGRGGGGGRRAGGLSPPGQDAPNAGGVRRADAPGLRRLAGAFAPVGGGRSTSSPREHPPCGRGAPEGPFSMRRPPSPRTPSRGVGGRPRPAATWALYRSGRERPGPAARGDTRDGQGHGGARPGRRRRERRERVRRPGRDSIQRRPASPLLRVRASANGSGTAIIGILVLRPQPPRERRWAAGSSPGRRSVQLSRKDVAARVTASASRASAPGRP